MSKHASTRWRAGTANVFFTESGADAKEFFVVREESAAATRTNARGSIPDRRNTMSAPTHHVVSISASPNSSALLPYPVASLAAPPQSANGITSRQSPTSYDECADLSSDLSSSAIST